MILSSSSKIVLIILGVNSFEEIPYLPPIIFGIGKGRVFCDSKSAVTTS
jgi:hypothetical protein